MKGMIDYTGEICGIPDHIYQYGIIHEDNPEAVELPFDFSHDRYIYTPQTSGVYDPNGFTLRPEPEQQIP